MDVVSSLHLLRPQWLWLLLALPFLVAAWWWQRRRRNVWREVVDAHLLPALIEHAPGRRGYAGLAWSLCGFLLVVLALAGPAWRMGEQPLVRGGSPLVVAVDLSSSATANDLPPSRLLQMRAKLRTLLASRREGAVGLVAFAGDAFVVAPVSDDAANIDLFVDALSPELMPEDGSRAGRAIAISRQLLQQAGHARGDILLMTDHADAEAIASAASAAAQGYRVSAIGVGTPTGAAYRRGDGSIAHAQLDRMSLQAMTRAGQGVLAELSNDQRDLEAVSALRPPASAAAGEGGIGRAWRDEGYWLLLPLLGLVLLAFRRGAVFAVLLLCVGSVGLWPLPGQTQARVQAIPAAPASSAPAAVKGTWWRRADQVEHARLRDGVQAYREGDFAQAGQRWSGLQGADAAYNRGNALAKGGQLAEAIAAYDEALRLQPGMEDALANRKAVEAAMQDRPHQGKGAQTPSPSSNAQPPQAPGQTPQSGEPAEGKPGEGKPADGKPQPDAQSSPPGSSQSPPSQPPSPADGSPAQDRSANKPPPPSQAPQQQAAQSDADRAQREQMQRALQESQQQAEEGTPVDAPPERAESAAEREQRQANEAWLRRIPDDPGGLLRARFLLEQQRRQGARPDR